jgi:hypothetical protein
MPTFSDYLQRVQSGSSLVAVNTGTWVQLVNNATSAAFVSTAATDAAGGFTVSNVPAGSYSVNTGPSAIGPWTATGDTGYIVADEPGWVNVRDYGAKADGTDDAAAITAALTACSAAGGGVTLVPVGNYRIGSRIVVPFNVELRGLGCNSSAFTALGSFPINTELVRLGDLSGNAGTGCRITDVKVDCNNISGSIGVYSERIGENSGIYRCTVTNYGSRGIQMKQPASGTLPLHYTIDDVLITSGSGTGAGAIGLDIAMTSLVTVMRQVRSVTVNATGFTQLTTAIKVDGASGAMQGIHIENAVTGILIGSVLACNGLSVCDVDGAATVTNLVLVSSSTTSRAIFLADLRPASATNALVDQQFSNTITVDIGSYVIGRNGWVEASDGNVLAQVGRLKVSKDLQRSRQTPTETVLVSGVDATAGEVVQVTLTAGRAVGAPLNPAIGQSLTFVLVQDGTGGRAVTWNAVFKQAWSDTGNTLSKRSTITFTYDGTNWNQVGAQSPYI